MRRQRARHAVEDDVVAPEAGVLTATPPEDLSVNPGGNRLGERLVAAELATAEQVASALSEAQTSGKRVGRILVERGIIDEEELVSVLATQHNVPMVDFRTVTPAAEAVALMNETTARSLAAIPIAL